MMKPIQTHHTVLNRMIKRRAAKNIQDKRLKGSDKNKISNIVLDRLDFDNPEQRWIIVAVQTGQRICCADRAKGSGSEHPAHRAAI